MDDELLAFVPTAVLCPGLATLLSLRSRIGVGNPPDILVTLLDPLESNQAKAIAAVEAGGLAPQPHGCSIDRAASVPSATS